MTLQEMNFSENKINFADLFKNFHVVGISKFNLQDIAKISINSGFPQYFNLPISLLREKMSNYLKQLLNPKINGKKMEYDKERM
jgi:hypothetical protein